jgi:hypothetical protein
MHLPNTIFSGYHGSCHCQGIAIDRQGGYIYYSFTTMLVKSDLQGNVIGSVDGLIGHLGCIDFCERDRRVYGSLEYKNDAIGRGILKNLNIRTEVKNAFYCAIFDVDKIDRMNMSAEADGIMRAVYLPEVVEDFEAQVTVDGVTLPHRYGCSGIDGIGWGPRFGGNDGEQLCICYGIYGDVTRPDNDDQIILAYDAADWWDTVAAPLNQVSMHRCGARSLGKYFIRTGNTNWGVQNLEYDAHTQRWMLAVYRGSKPQFPNYDMFFLSADTAPTPAVHEVTGEHIVRLMTDGEGIYFPYGSTGMVALGDGSYYFSQQGKDEQRGQYTTAVLYRATNAFRAPFVPAE